MIQSKKFRNIKTGEISTVIPILTIADWEEYDGADEPTTCTMHGPRAVTTCGNCNRQWCGDCDPAPAALCHYCHGRGYSHAPLDS